MDTPSSACDHLLNLDPLVPRVSARGGSIINGDGWVGAVIVVYPGGRYKAV